MNTSAPKAFVLLTVTMILVTLGIAGCTRAKSGGVVPSSVEGTPQATPVGTGAAVVSVEGTPTSEMPVGIRETAQANTTPAAGATSTPVVAATNTPVPATPTPTTTGQTTTYVVQWGDTLYSIARRCGTTVENIVKANNIADPNSIRAGQQLTLSCGGTTTTVEHIVKAGENLFRIALMYNTTVEAIAATNGIVNPSFIWVGQRLRIPQGAGTPPTGTGRYHVVQPGETLYSIALQYGTTTAAIAVANDLSNPNLIYPGQTLLIPK